MMNTYFDISYGEEYLDLYIPENPIATFVYFHGGGIESGDKKNDSLIFEYLVSRGICAVSANYRMYPAAHFPEFILDAASAVKWVINNIKRYGGSEKIFVGGSSAGGYLSQMLCFNEEYLGDYSGKISGYLHDAGQPTSHFNVLREKGIDTRRVIVDETAPLYYVCDKKYPPMLIIVSDNDMENRYEQTMLLMSTLKHFGSSSAALKVMNGTHCAYISKRDKEGNSILGQIIEEFIKSAL
jgi:dipeptidyl aminopeptidase/acylaminoacyl peptidase